MRRKFLWALALVAFASPASALTVLQLNLEQLSALSEKVFVGRCASVVQERDSAGRPVQVITYDVSDMLKGPPAEHVTFRQLGFTDGEMLREQVGGVSVEGVFRELPRYDVGEEAVVFLSEEGRLGLTAPVGLMQGKFAVQAVDGGKLVANGQDNRGLFIGWKESPKIKSLSLSTKEKSLVKRNGGAIPYEDFVSLVKKITTP